MVRQAIPEVHYLIVGKGDDRQRIERIVAELGLESCVTLAGFIPDEELCRPLQFGRCLRHAQQGRGLWRRFFGSHGLRKAGAGR